VWKTNDNGTEVVTLADIVAGKPYDLDGLTLVLPADIGGLDKGTINGSKPHDPSTVYDVADQDGKRGFVQGDLPSGANQVFWINPNLVGHTGCPMWRWWVARPGKKTLPSGGMLLRDHLDAAEKAAMALTHHLDLSPTEVRAVTYAALHHDLGKDRSVWQTGMGNTAYPKKVIAKSGNPNLRPQHHYRHELGSLVDIQQRADFALEPSEVQDLILHLVAVHHGRGRPGFQEVEQWVPGSADAFVRSLVLDVSRRFARLTARYGWCRLAYLESLLRAIDVHTF
jgi:CRISPR-associated endonuclease/helicase Cas3